MAEVNEAIDDIKFLLHELFGGNVKRMERIVTDGLNKAKKENNFSLVEKIERDLKLIRQLQ